MDIGAVVLHKILKEQSLEGWARLRISYFSSAYTSIYTAINKFYTTYSNLPTFSELEVVAERHAALSSSIAALEMLEVPDIELDVAIDALINQFAQNETVKELNTFVEGLPLMGVDEIKESLSGIVLTLDERTLASDSVYTASNMQIFNAIEDTEHGRVPTGLNNTLDATIGGAYRQDYILIGGYRGSGKSIVCSNLAENQRAQGNVAVYFTIEMRGSEVFQRNCSIGARISHQNLRNNCLTDEETLSLVRYRAESFVDGEAAVERFLEHRDKFRFERELRSMPLKSEGQIIIVDDRSLSLATIDLHLQRLKAQYKDKLTLGIIDYVNQVTYPGLRNVAGSMYDWKVQIELSKQLKNLARKHDLPLISPMQTDKDNGVRFAQGLLDAADVAMTLNAHTKEDSCITFDITKARSAPAITVTSGIDWISLAISPVDVPSPSNRKEEKKTKKQDKDDDTVPWEV